MTNPIFNQIQTPKIYAYSDVRYPQCLKIGYTAQETVLERMKQHYPTKTPSQSWTLEYETLAIKDDGTVFKDFAIHAQLKKMGIMPVAGEWFKCDVDTLKNAILMVKQGKTLERQRTQDFKMRPEQQDAVEKTAHYFNSIQQEKHKNRTPHFLWNAKMRFGKTFATYQLAKRMKWQKVLILTFKPAVKSAWQEDLESHSDFDGWQFISRDSTLTIDTYDKSKPMVYFGSFQDVLGKDKYGNIKARNEWIHTVNWDCVVFDEYHYGAWRDNAKGLFAKDEQLEQKQIDDEQKEMEMNVVEFDENELPITTNHYLYLSGTPFRAIASGEFIEEQIFNWTYGDEQREKLNWDLKKGDNPYASLPQMMLLTYQLPEHIRAIASAGEFNEFDLNEFFKADGSGDKARFKHQNEVQKWLDLIRDNLDEMIVTNFKQGNAKPPMPFSDVNLLNNLRHTFWFLPSVASCEAMNNLLKQSQNKFYQDYEIIVAAGNNVGMGDIALVPVKQAMSNNPLNSKSITLSCGKLTTGVSVPPWTGIFMLRNSSSPETYFQAAFRVQTPWAVRDEENQTHILKHQCYVFDFAPNRALKQIADYSCKLNTQSSNPEHKVAEFIQFLPILAYDGSAMQQVDAKLLLDMAMSGTTATLLARRWQSALLVNVDNFTLQTLMDNRDAMEALMKIEEFRSLNDDIVVVINRSEKVKALKKKAGEQELDEKEKKTLTEEEKKEKSLRKQIQEKLIKFATRIPIFMYLSDYREHSLKDVISELEPELFTKVTGLSQADFALLVSLNVFNESVMNDAVYKFKRYEDASLEYVGIDKKDEYIGLFNTRIKRDDIL